MASDFFGSVEFGAEDDGDETGDSWTYNNLHPIRPGMLYKVRKNAPRIDFGTFTSEVTENQPQKNHWKMNEIIKEQLGYRHSTLSPSHLALVRLDDDEVNSLLTCWKCDTKMALGRGELVRAVEHAIEFEGDILVSRYRIDVRNSQLPFETKTNHRKWRGAPPVSFRRASEFVATGFISE